MEGTKVVFYCEDMEAEGTLERSHEDASIWVGNIDWVVPRDLEPD